jgi:hypothetical protein
VNTGENMANTGEYSTFSAWSHWAPDPQAVMRLLYVTAFNPTLSPRIRSTTWM